MAAALIPMIAGKAKGSGGDLVSKALTNDVAVLRGTTKPRGKGKKKKGGGLEYEIHVNPASVGMGAVALGGAALLGAGALYLGGMNLSRQDSQAKNITVRNDGTEDKPMWRIYSARGIPMRNLGSGFMPKDLVTPAQISEGWFVNGIQKVNDDLFNVLLQNDKKRHFALSTRNRNPWFQVFGDNSTGGTIIPDLAPGIPWFLRWPFLPTVPPKI